MECIYNVIDLGYARTNYTEIMYRHQKIIRVIIIVLMILLIQKSYSQSSLKNFGTGSINSILNNKRHGHWEIYDIISNEILAKGLYRNGVKIGLWKYYSYYSDFDEAIDINYETNKILIYGDRNVYNKYIEIAKDRSQVIFNLLGLKRNIVKCNSCNGQYYNCFYYDKASGAFENLNILHLNKVIEHFDFLGHGLWFKFLEGDLE